MEVPKRYMVVSQDMLWVHAQTDSIEEARRIRELGSTSVAEPLIDGLQDDLLDEIFIYDTVTEEYVG